jgi:hypothetical protein
MPLTAGKSAGNLKTLNIKSLTKKLAVLFHSNIRKITFLIAVIEFA